MNKNIFKIVWTLVLGCTIGFASCDKNPDESNLYTVTGQTIEDFLQEHDDTLTMFNAIMKRAGTDRLMASYGQYTCFAPTNKGVQMYLDSLWNDTSAVIPNNGLKAATVEGMTDSLCNEFVKYHLVNGLFTTLDMGGGGVTIPTMLGRSMTSSVNTAGHTMLNNTATIINEDNEMTNGYVHITDSVVKFSASRIPDVMQRDGRFSIFHEALVKTGLADSLLVADKGKTYYMSSHGDTDGTELYYPKECKINFTVFAETDEVLRKKAGINSFDDLVTYCIKAYGNCKQWYDYPKEMGIDISTGTDYTNRFNVVNMFVAYHILNQGMGVDNLVYERPNGAVDQTTNPWNYVLGGEPYEYYETLLPHTLMKIWQPITTRGTDQKGNVDATTKTNYINRYITFNTLTDELGTMGTDAMHTYVWQGVKVNRKILTAYNGYIHPINDMLIYDAQVPQGVLNERMRFDSMSFLPEMTNNGIRGALSAQVSALNGGGSGARCAFPQDYFDNVVCYTDGTVLRSNVRGAYRAYQADTFQGWGNYDLAIKIPPVPSGDYELRLFYQTMGHGGMMQFYLGNSSNQQSMKALSIPLDVRIDKADERIGWTDPSTEDDAGVATDKALRNRGYMRCPMSFTGHPDGTNSTGVTSVPHGSTIAEINAIVTGTQNCRTDPNGPIVRILSRQHFSQKEDYWLRIKSVINDDPNLKWQLDYIELVPVNIVDNDQYSEDWY